MLEPKPIIYGSFGVSSYLGNFKKFDDIDILINNALLEKDWPKFKKILESNNFILLNEKEHEFSLGDYKVGFAKKSILIRDKIIKDYSELIKYKNIEAYTLVPRDFLKAYRFSQQDGYRINSRQKKDREIIIKLENYIKNNKL
jgi:hypothetical protein